MHRTWRLAAAALFVLAIVAGAFVGDHLLALSDHTRDRLRLYTELLETSKQAYGKDSVPDFMSVGGYDAMAAAVHVIRTLKGKIETDKALAALKGWKHNSPRGPIMIDPVTRDVIMNEYLSEVMMKDGRLYMKNIGLIPHVKDPCKELKVGRCGN